MEEEVRRVTVRLAAPLYRALSQQAQEAGLDFSKYLRQLVLERQPHLAAFDDLGKIMAASQGATTVADYAAYLASMKRRLEAALDDLDGFEARAAGWRQDAERELRAALADVEAKLKQAGVLTELGHIYGKVFAQVEGRDEGE